MDCRLSKLMKNVIILNVILTVIAMGVHSYNIYRTYETHGHITRMMEEKQVIRDTAIRMLEKEGVDLYLGFSTGLFAMCNCIAAMFVIYFYSQNSDFLSGFFAAFFSIFANLIGGFLFFYVFFSLKGEQLIKSNNYSDDSEWKIYIHNKAALI